MRRRFFILAAAFLLIAGCSRGQTVSDAVPEESMLILDKNGTVTSVTVETYDSDIYSEDELKESSEMYLADFNGSGSGEAELSECFMRDGVARLGIKFSDGTAYLRFMEMYPDDESRIQVTKLDIATVPDGVSKGYIAGGSFIKPDGKTASAGDIMKETKLYVAAVEGEALIRIDGTIDYLTTNAELTDSGFVRTPGEGTSFIIFE